MTVSAGAPLDCEIFAQAQVEESDKFIYTVLSFIHSLTTQACVHPSTVNDVNYIDEINSPFNTLRSCMQFSGPPDH